MTMAEARVYVEEKVEITPDVWGTCDAAIIVNNVAVIVDFKYGAGVAVSPKDNPQMYCYALGILRRHPEVEKVRVVIVQPRAQGDAIKEHWITAAELVAWGDEVLLPAVGRVVTNREELCAGDHCRFCPALAICPEHSKRMLAEAQMDFGRVTPPAPDDLTIEQLSKVLALSEIINAWVGSCKAYAQSRLEMGYEVPGWKLVAKRSVRKWSDEAEAKLPEILGDAAYERRLVSPATAEKVAKKLKLNVDSLKPLWVKPENGYALAQDTDKRAEIACPAAAEFEPLLQ